MSRTAVRPALLVMLATLVVACGPGRPGRLAADVARYLDTMQVWAAAEVEAGKTIERLLATHFVDDTEVLREIADSRPRVQRHLHDIRAYRPETEDIGAVHRRYVDAWVVLLSAYADLERGLEEADATTLSVGRDGLLTWRRTLRSVAEDLRELAALTRAPLPKRNGPA